MAMMSNSAPLGAADRVEAVELVPALSWQAVVGGALAANVIVILLVTLGFGLGLSSVSPWPASGAGAGAFAIMTAVWLIVAQWISAAVGGYLAGRLRLEGADAHPHEAFFRDTAHGFLAWGLATLIGASALTSTLSSIAGAGAHAASSLGAGVEQAAGAAQPYLIDRLFRAATAQAAAPDDAAVRAEAARILANAAVSGKLPEDDKAYLAQIVGPKVGLTPAEVSKRVDEAGAQLRMAGDKAREAADIARKAAADLSFYLFFSMLIGAFIASVAAALGGSLRQARA